MSHGVRRPKRERVRSESRPSTGPARMATAAPTPVMTPRLSSLFDASIACSCRGEEDAGHGPPDDRVDDDVDRDDEAEEPLDGRREPLLHGCGRFGCDRLGGWFDMERGGPPYLTGVR